MLKPRIMSCSKMDRVFVTNKQIRDDLQDSITGYAYYKNDDCCGYLTVKLDGTPEAPY